jgi:hypothetical protein
MRFQVLMVSMKVIVFWDVSRLVETDRHFGGTYCVHHQGLNPPKGVNDVVLGHRYNCSVAFGFGDPRELQSEHVTLMT